jgi:nucleotide-binding universal stress UspA family protein
MNAMTVLVATDGSACAQVGLDLARSIPWPEGTNIHLVTVVEPASLAYFPMPLAAAGDPAKREPPLIGGLADEFAKMGANLRAAERQVETHVLVGRPATAIVDQAKAVKADLIIVGSRGHGTIGSMVLGSVSAEVADHAHCPVLVARNSRWTSAILGVDGSPFGEAAERLVGSWPIFAGVQIEVLSVADVDLPWASSMALIAYAGSIDYKATEQAIEADQQRVADGAVRRLRSAGRVAATRPMEGDAAAQLVLSARDEDADLIVVGTHGQTGVRRVLAGSVARNVMLHAQCSVLVVRETPPLT